MFHGSSMCQLSLSLTSSLLLVSADIYTGELAYPCILEMSTSFDAGLAQWNGNDEEHFMS